MPDAVPLDAIARAAGVGTLYRHFPTREALVEALYAAELDEVVSSASALLAELEPPAALRAWMTRYAEFFRIKRGMSDTLRAGWASDSIATPATRERITATIAELLSSGAEAGSLRSDVEPDDVTMMLLGVFLSTTAIDSPERTGPLLDLLVDATASGPGAGRPLKPLVGPQGCPAQARAAGEPCSRRVRSVAAKSSARASWTRSLATCSPAACS